MKFFGYVFLIFALIMVLKAVHTDISQWYWLRGSLKGLVYAIVGGSLLIAGYLKDIKEK